MSDKANRRLDDLHSTLDHLQKFEDSAFTVRENLERCIDTLSEDRPVGGDVESIKQQQDEFKQFQRDEVEPLQRSVESVNKSGQNLVQSASRGVSTAQLEEELEELNDRWAQVNQKVGIP